MPDPGPFAAECAAILAATGDEDAAALAAADRLAAAADTPGPRQGDAVGAIFAGVVEPLNDRFDPIGRARYARYFGRMVWRSAAADPDLRRALASDGVADETALLARHRRLRQAGDRVVGEPRVIAVLSRVTVGADVLLTSVLLQHLRHRWPAARLVLLGDRKLGGLFGGLPGLELQPVVYARRGGLGERLRAWLPLRKAVADLDPDLVVGPDSRLDQLGLLPLGADPGRYLLWENLSPGDPRSLVDLLADWCRRRLGPAPDFLPRLWFDPTSAEMARRLAVAGGPVPRVAVKFDHGGNPAKALPRPAECRLLAALRERGWRILLDRGFGDEELAASDALLAELGWSAVDLDDSGTGRGRPVGDLMPGELAAAPFLRFHGSISGWAAALAGCGLALSYDSVGHHLAAALGVPLVTAFTGFDHPGFPVAWRPRGAGPIGVVVIPPDRRGLPAEWERVVAALPVAPG
jgi:ADP-heptose:LPS heptosyltransferase